MLFRLWLVVSTIWALVVGIAVLPEAAHPGRQSGSFEWIVTLFPFFAGIVLRKLFWFVLIGGQPKVIPAPRDPRFKV